MKTILAIVLAGLAAFSVCAQTNSTATPKKHHKKKDGSTNAPTDGTPEAAAEPAADPAKMIEQYQKLFAPSDPWRIMNDHTNFAKGPEWVQFEGIVVRASGDGILLKGWFGQPLAYMLPPGNNAMTSGLFYLNDYPRAISVGQLLSRNDRLVALKSGTKDDLTVLDYGMVWVPQLTDDQKAAAVDAKAKSDAKMLAWQKDEADKGDAYAQFKLGLRYLNGDGVDKDAGKARDLFNKAAAQGYQNAIDELAKLPPAN